ncbi:hypothetical protein SDD30_08175 [Moorella naiadis]|uniref:hypothetical protein n=1 Tax=Moorella naiadis (nom. illeg.) TaxID=3093670 RepID=UPI003D9CB06F
MLKGGRTKILAGDYQFNEIAATSFIQRPFSMERLNYLVNLSSTTLQTIIAGCESPEEVRYVVLLMRGAIELWYPAKK